MKKKSISEVQIVPIKPRDGLVAFCSFVLFESMYCGSVAIYTRPRGGIRLVYLTKDVGSKSVSIFYPITKQFGQDIVDAVSEKYEEVMNKKDDRYNRRDF